MSTNTPTFKLCMAVQENGKVYEFHFYTHFFTEQERDAFVATMPKSLKPNSYSVCGFDVVNRFGLKVKASLAPTKNNTKNETGIKRFTKFVELYSPNIVCMAFVTNAVTTLDEAIAHVNALDAE